MTYDVRLTTYAMLRSPWLLLAASALGLELAALYFQYRMDLNPCVLCVYERTAVAGIFLGGVIGAIAPQYALFRWIGLALWALGAGWGLQLSLEHSGIQSGAISVASCDFLANYPDWAKLDQWLPWLFEPTGYCDEIQWQFMSYSMPQWMVVICVIYLTVLTLIIIGQLLGKRLH